MGIIYATRADILPLTGVAARLLLDSLLPLRAPHERYARHES